MTEQVMVAAASSYVISPTALAAADRAAFTQELTEAVNHLAGKYHNGKGRGRRKHRLIVALHPRLKPAHEPRRIGIHPTCDSQRANMTALQ